MTLCKILQDEVTMYAYEGAFSLEEVQEWLERQLVRYDKWGFGLWAVILNGTMVMYYRIYRQKNTYIGV